jgi:hypothetical protein
LLLDIIACFYPFIRWISRITGPAQRPGIDKVHGTAVSSPCAGVSFRKVLVVAMGSIATAVAIAKRDGPCITGQKLAPNHRQSSEDGGDGQDAHNLLPWKGLIDQFWAALGALAYVSTTLATQNRVRRVWCIIAY